MFTNKHSIVRIFTEKTVPMRREWLTTSTVAWSFVFFPVNKDGFITRLFHTFLLFVDMHPTVNIRAIVFNWKALLFPGNTIFVLSARTILLWLPSMVNFIHTGYHKSNEAAASSPDSAHGEIKFYPFFFTLHVNIKFEASLINLIDKVTGFVNLWFTIGSHFQVCIELIGLTESFALLEAK